MAFPQVLLGCLPDSAAHPDQSASCSDEQIRSAMNTTAVHLRYSCSSQGEGWFVRPNLLIFFVDLLRLHGLLCLISFLNFNQGGAGYTENAVNVHPHFHLHLGAFTRRLRDDFLDKELTCEIKNNGDFYTWFEYQSGFYAVNIKKIIIRGKIGALNKFILIWFWTHHIQQYWP